MPHSQASLPLAYPQTHSQILPPLRMFLPTLTPSPHHAPRISRISLTPSLSPRSPRCQSPGFRGYNCIFNLNRHVSFQVVLLVVGPTVKRWLDDGERTGPSSKNPLFLHTWRAIIELRAVREACLVEVGLEFRLEGNTGRERSRHRFRQRRAPRRSLLRREAGSGL